MAKTPDTPPDQTETDLAGYDHSEDPVVADADEPLHSDTYKDKDHDGGWSSQVGMEDFKDRSGGDAYARMSRGILDENYGRGPEGLGADKPPQDRD